MVQTLPLGTKAEINLALPGAYVRLSGLLLRLAQANETESLFVFKIDKVNYRYERKYREYLDSLADDV
jgi:hypothetical protein